MNDISVNQAAKFAGSTSQVPNNSALLGEADFLKLLAVQLQYQDPLDPMENTEFIAQMAQFSTLEGITSMSSSMKGMSEQIISMNNLYTTSLIGKSVKVYGDGFTLPKGETKELEYLLTGGVTSIKVSITDSSGTQIRVINAGSQQAGSNKILWDGLDETGVVALGGDYTFSVEAIGSDGSDVKAATLISNKVDGIVYENSIPYLMIDGAMVGIHEILEIWG